jgi:hypothetical protein
MFTLLPYPTSCAWYSFSVMPFSFSYIIMVNSNTRDPTAVMIMTLEIELILSYYHSIQFEQLKKKTRIAQSNSRSWEAITNHSI